HTCVDTRQQHRVVDAWDLRDLQEGRQEPWTNHAVEDRGEAAFRERRRRARGRLGHHRVLLMGLRQPRLDVPAPDETQEDVYLHERTMVEPLNDRTRDR